MGKKILDVPTGYVKVGRRTSILRANGIGSCVVVIAYDTVTETGGIAHIMLPGISPEITNNDRTKYAHDAVSELARRMKKLGACLSDSAVCLVGGANVLQRQDTTIAEDNIASVRKILCEYGVEVCAQNIGGVYARKAQLDIGTGIIWYGVVGQNEGILWSEQDA